MKILFCLVCFLFFASPVGAVIVINEFLPNPSGPSNEDTEWVELYNSGNDQIDLSGWIIDDIEGGSSPYNIASGSGIVGGDFLVFEKSQTKVGFNNSDDTIRLINSSGNVVDSYSYKSTEEDVSIGRNSDGVGVWVKCQLPTKGSSNNCLVPTQTSNPTSLPTITPKPTSIPTPTNTLNPTSTLSPLLSLTTSVKSGVKAPVAGISKVVTPVITGRILINIGKKVAMNAAEVASIGSEQVLGDIDELSSDSPDLLKAGISVDTRRILSIGLLISGFVCAIGAAGAFWFQYNKQKIC